MKSKKWLLSSSVAVLALAAVGYYVYHTNSSTKSEAEYTSDLHTNFYQSVNYDWLTTTEIPKDKAAVGDAEDMQEEVLERLHTDADNWLNATSVPEGLEEFIAYWKLASDYDTREALGGTEIKKDTDSVLNSSLEDILSNTSYLTASINVPFTSNVTQSFVDKTKNDIVLGMPETLLKSIDLYADDEVYTMYKEMWETSTI